MAFQFTTKELLGGEPIRIDGPVTVEKLAALGFHVTTKDKAISIPRSEEGERIRNLILQQVKEGKPIWCPDDPKKTKTDIY